MSQYDDRAIRLHDNKTAMSVNIIVTQLRNNSGLFGYLGFFKFRYFASSRGIYVFSSVIRDDGWE